MLIKTKSGYLASNQFVNSIHRINQTNMNEPTNNNHFINTTTATAMSTSKDENDSMKGISSNRAHFVSSNADQDWIIKIELCSAAFFLSIGSATINDCIFELSNDVNQHHGGLFFAILSCVVCCNPCVWRRMHFWSSPIFGKCWRPFFCSLSSLTHFSLSFSYYKPL